MKPVPLNKKVTHLLRGSPYVRGFTRDKETSSEWTLCNAPVNPKLYNSTDNPLKVNCHSCKIRMLTRVE